MKLINELKVSLSEFLTLDKRRLDGMVKLLLGLLMVRSINLKKIACGMFGEAKMLSKYRRLQRLFSGCRLDYNAIARLIFRWFKFSTGKHYLILDRTNWQLGKRDINVLFLCIAYKKIAIPMFCLILKGKGNSSTKERIALIERFINVFGRDNILGVLGDREFIGYEWFAYLNNRGLAFYIRIKKDADTTNKYGKNISVHWLFYNLRLHEARRITGQRLIYGHRLSIMGMRLKDDYLIVVTNRSSEDILNIYSIRWEIETLFGCLKTKGFYFEDTHITHRARLKKVVAMLSIAFCWAHVTGEWRHRHDKVIPLKKHGRPQYSLFRYGLDWIVEALIQRGYQLRRLTTVLTKLLKPNVKGNISTGLLA
jgi:hypothetical protein